MTVGGLIPSQTYKNLVACEDNTAVVTLGQQYNVGEKSTAILYTYINHHAQPPIIPQHNLSNT